MGDWSIDIQDFQSIKKAHIDVPSGLTIIRGKTNEGKSAVFRAIDCAIFNTGTDDLVRAGKKVAGVTISNGSHTMTYLRNAASKSEKSAYQFDGGAVQKKVGRSQLPEVQKMFNVTDVRMQNGVKMKLNFWPQNDRPFLMDKTSGQLYEFLTLSSAERYFKILKSMAADIKVQEAEINNYNTVIDTLKSVNNSKKEFLGRNKGFDDVYTQIITLGQEADKLNKSLGIVETLETLQSRISSISLRLQDVSARYDAIPMQDISKSYSDLEVSSKSYDKLFSMVSSVASTRKSIQSISALKDDCDSRYSYTSSVLISTENDVQGLDIICGSVYQISSHISSCESLRDKIYGISQRISDLRIPDISYEELESSISSVSSIQSDVMRFSQMISNVSGIVSRVSGIESGISAVSDRILESENTLEQFKSDVGYCPFCGSVFSKSVGHSH